MDYEKKKRLAKLRDSMKSYGYMDGVEELEDIFPELKEDERIRKWLIEMVEELRKANPTNAEHNGNCSEAIAYLERQKEREDKLYEKTKDRFYKEGVDDGILIGKEQQKKQQPAEWSEEDRNMARTLASYLEMSEGHFSCNGITKDEFIQWLKSPRPQPKQEWSEDEKIREELWDYFHNLQLSSDCDFSPSLTIDDILAYLERQKEQQPKEKISVSEELYEHIRNACACIDDAMSSDTMCDIADYLEMANSSAQKAFDMVEKLVVKKPVEWSKEDDAAHTRILGAVAKAFMGVLPTKPSEEDIHWFKSLPERFNLQPKLKWSEGEMKVLDSIIDDYQKAAKSFCGYDGKIMLLKAIRDGEYDLSKQKWSEEDIKKIRLEEYTKGFNDAAFGGNLKEWSEEDEKMIERLIRHTQEEYDELCNDRYGHQEIVSDLKESCRERMNWLENRLKFLRPQPKRELYEEDNVIKNVISYLNGEYGFKTHDDEDAYRRGLVRQLKSLQPHWKPSEEQMKEYRYWYKNFVESGLASPSSKAVTVLGELLEQLKKL